MYVNFSAINRISLPSLGRAGEEERLPTGSALWLKQASKVGLIWQFVKIKYCKSIANVLLPFRSHV